MAAALARIGAAFDEASIINMFKLRVERWLRLGPSHPAVRARFGARASALASCSLGAAIVRVERWWREERSAFAVASAFGRGSRLSLDVLSELRLILRLLRRKRLHRDFFAIVAAVRAEPIERAAR